MYLIQKDTPYGVFFAGLFGGIKVKETRDFTRVSLMLTLLIQRRERRDP